MTTQTTQTATKPFDKSLFDGDKDVEEEERLIMKRANNYKPLTISFDDK